MNHASRRKAVSLIIVLAVMAMIGSVVVALTYHAVTMHEQLRNQRLQATARYCAQSATELLRRNPDSLSPANEPLVLDLDALLAGGIRGQGEVHRTAIDDAPSCEIDIHLQLSRQRHRLRTPVTLSPQP